MCALRMGRLFLLTEIDVSPPATPILVCAQEVYSRIAGRGSQGGYLALRLLK